ERINLMNRELYRSHVRGLPVSRLNVPSDWLGSRHEIRCRVFELAVHGVRVGFWSVESLARRQYLVSGRPCVCVCYRRGRDWLQNALNLIPNWWCKIADSGLSSAPSSAATSRLRRVSDPRFL